jgi:hypothetical protein
MIVITRPDGTTEQIQVPMREETRNIDPLSPEGVEARLQFERERPASSSADTEWVLRSGDPVQIPKGTAQAGDTPYDQVSARQGAQSGSGPSPLALMAVQDPTILDDMPPTEFARLMREIAEAKASGDVEFMGTAARTNLQVVDDALETVNTLLTTGEAGARPGVGPVVGRLPAMPGEAFDYSALIEQLSAQLTLPKLRFLRGLGHMSDREFGTIRDSVSILRRGLRDETFDAELAKIKSDLEASQRQILSEGAQSNTPTPPPEGGGRIRFDAEGNEVQ